MHILQNPTGSSPHFGFSVRWLCNYVQSSIFLRFFAVDLAQLIIRIDNWIVDVSIRSGPSPKIYSVHYIRTV